MPTPVPERLGLSLQQPWAELILRGVKTMEIRSLPVVPGKTIYLYAGKRCASQSFARDAVAQHQLDLNQLTTGMVVGTVDIVDCRLALADDEASALVPAEILAGKYSWVLGHPQRWRSPLPPLHVPYGVWFYPFRPLPSAASRQRRS